MHPKKMFNLSWNKMSTWMNTYETFKVSDKRIIETQQTTNSPFSLDLHLYRTTENYFVA